MIQTRALQRLKANMVNFGAPTMEGSHSTTDQSDVIATADATSGTEFTGDNNAPGGDLSTPTEASANNPVIAPSEDFKPWDPNPDSSPLKAESALRRIKANLLGV